MGNKAIKKVLLLIAILMPFAAAQATMVTCVSEGNNVVRVDYDATGQTVRHIAFALDVTVNNGATIQRIYDYKIGDSNAASPGYGIFPSAIKFDETGKIIDWGSPDVNIAAAGIKGGTGTAGVTIEMAARYAGVEDAPAVKGTLCRIAVAAAASQAVNVTVAANSMGGGVVLEDGSIDAAKFSGCILNSYSPGEPPPPPPPPPTQGDTVTILKAEYRRSTAELRVEATSSRQPEAVLTVTGYGKMLWQADKNKYVLVAKPAADPAGKVTVVSSLGGSAVKTVTYKEETAKFDVITIAKAEYSLEKKELRVEATSSAQPKAKLTVVGYGTMTWNSEKQKYEYRAKPVAKLGSTITVKSDLGGSASKSVVLK